MSGRRGGISLGVFCAVVAATLSLPSAAEAQGGSGFRFKPPVGSFTIRGGFAAPRASSQIFDFTREQLTLEKSDFNSTAWGADLAIRVADRADIVLGVGLTYSRTGSEFRDFVDLDDLPIQQTTKFVRVPTTLSLKWYLGDRGRSVGRFAWIPASFSPYVGAGGGVLWYEFEQEGDFVDIETLDIFFDIIESSGTTGTGHVFLGSDLSLSPRFALTGEGRYSFGNVRMDQDFIGFDNIDLSGFQVTLGIAVRF